MSSPVHNPSAAIAAAHSSLPRRAFLAGSLTAAAALAFGLPARAHAATARRLGAFSNPLSLDQVGAELSCPIAIDSRFVSTTDIWPTPASGRQLLVAWQIDPMNGGSRGNTYTYWASGKGDSLVIAAAKRCAAIPGTVLVRPWAEMNGDWNYAPISSKPWGQPTDFVRAWRRVIPLFRRYAPNAKILFNPTTDTYAGTVDVAALWPGAAYVDEFGLDGYNWATTQTGGWREFTTIYAGQYARLQALAPLPVTICEVSCAEQPDLGSKGQWWRNMFAALPTQFPMVRDICFFSTNKERDWRLDSSADSLSGLNAGLRSVGL